ncbi:helix-turn-helix transcriptional regulator [Ruegeria atlantica]|uniref:helix-turn-helix transcriptional regulator n=1 Tax=Ruegeria atlantica TaxID=81569 RepID=UPI0024949D76|nr:AraC family transcriptional regulator [Ruegeria atlantica]
MPANSLQAGSQDGFIRLSLVQPFVNYLIDRQIDPRRTFEDHGLSVDTVKDPSLFVHSEVVYGLLNAFAGLADDRYLGVHVGELHDFSKWSPFAESVATSTTLGQFFAKFIQRIPRETNSVEHKLIIEPGSAVYRVARLQEPGIDPIQVTGFGAAHYVRLLRSVTGDAWDASQVSFESRFIVGVPSGYAGIETRLVDDPGMRLHFPAKWLFQELNFDSSVAQRQSDQSGEEISVVTAMRSVLRNRLADPDLGTKAVAKMLGVETDRLRKALKRHGTTLPRQIKRLKIDRAKGLLRDGDMKVADIGNLLGYDDNAHFTRFFRSQVGETPSSFRARALSSNPEHSKK